MRGSWYVRFGIITVVPVFFYTATGASFLLDFPIFFVLGEFFLAFLWFQICPHLKKTILILSTALVLFYMVFSWASQNNRVGFAFAQDRIVSLGGKLVEDSLLSRSGYQLLRLSLVDCATNDGAAGSAKGVVSLLSEVGEVLVSGSSIVCSGSFSDDGTLFFAEKLQVTDIPAFALLRRRVLHHLELRFHAIFPHEESRALAMMLLLGRSSDDAFSLKDLSLSSGCAHILALSGMHLQFFLSLSSIVCMHLFSKRKGRYIALVVPLLFVLLAGPKPSLVRAMGMYLCSLFLWKGSSHSYYAYACTALVQTLLFPESLSSAGCLFSYAAYGGLLCANFINLYRPKSINALFVSLFAVLFTAPASLLMTGTWQIAGIFIAPLASLLIFWAMALSLLALLFGSTFAIGVELLYHVLLSILEIGSRCFGGGFSWTGYLVYLLVVLTCLATIGYAERVLHRRRRNSYELEVRVRFTDSNNQTA